MLKRILASCLIVLILTSGYSRIYQYVGYALNQDFIARTLCVNIAKPKMNCKGKCYLAKKIKEAEQSEQKPEQSLSKKSGTEIFVKPVNDFFFLSIVSDKTQFYQRKIKASKAVKFIFHPPQLPISLS